MKDNEMYPSYMIMVLRWINALTPPLKQKLVQLIPKIIEALETKAQVTSYNRKLYLSIENKVRRKTTWEQNLPSKMDMEKNMKVNIIHHHVTPSPRCYLR